MADKKETKSDWKIHPPVRKMDEDKTVFYEITVKSEKARYPVGWLVPTTDEEAMERYGVKLDFIIAKGIRSGFATSPDYLSLVANKDGSLPPDWHEKAQAIADSWIPGRTEPSKTAETKRKAASADAAEARFDKSLEEIASMSDADLAKYFAAKAKSGK